MTDFESLALAATGKLFAYPDAEFFADLEQARAEAMACDAQDSDFVREVVNFVDNLQAMGQARAAEQYVAIFDHASAASLYLAWHRYGNDRSQGQAMAALNGLYRAYGFEPKEGALPDYLPRVLEFLSLAPARGRQILLDGFGPEMAALQKSLAEMQSPHAPLLAAALKPLQRDFPEYFKPRTGADPTKRPMACPEPEPLEPLIPPEVATRANTLHESSGQE